MTAAAHTFQEAELLIADAVGEVIEHWGFRKPLGRVWTVLYLAGMRLAGVRASTRLPRAGMAS